MAIWHEVTPIRCSIARASSDHSAYLHVRRTKANPNVYEAYFRRATVPCSDCAFIDQELQEELWPKTRILGRSMAEARAIALPLLEQVVAREIDGRFEVKPPPVPIHKQKIREIDHPTHRLVAWICKHDDARYEVRYFGALNGDDEEERWRLDVPEVPELTVPDGQELLTFAATEKEAEAISLLEMDRLVSKQRPPIQPR